MDTYLNTLITVLREKLKLYYKTREGECIMVWGYYGGYHGHSHLPNVVPEFIEVVW